MENEREVPHCKEAQNCCEEKFDELQKELDAIHSLVVILLGLFIGFALSTVL